MLLLIDVGNTNVVLGLAEGMKIHFRWRLATDRERTSDEYGLTIRGLLGSLADSLSGAILCSVVPRLERVLQRAIGAVLGLEILVVDPLSNVGMPVCYDPPAAVGPDRIVDSVAALGLYGSPLVVIDLGTATTFNAVSKAGEFLGGAICPGVETMAEALFARAARLPRVEIRKPDQVVGCSTVESIRSGVFYGTAGLVDGIARRMMAELGDEAKVIATGGWAESIAPESELIEIVDPDLTLKGLQIIYELNRKRPT